MKMTYVLGVASFLVLMTSSIANASLAVSVSVEYPQILPIQDQEITSSTNERGKGILFVIQPAKGTPWIDFLNDHPGLKALWNTLPNSIKTDVVGKIEGRIVSFTVISTGLGGGSMVVSFPDDFTGINGAPSTSSAGEYKVILAFLSYEASGDDVGCSLFEIGFDCIGWNVHVVPEVPFGTIAPLLSMIVALPMLKLYRKNHH